MPARTRRALGALLVAMLAVSAVAVVGDADPAPPAQSSAEGVAGTGINASGRVFRETFNGAPPAPEPVVAGSPLLSRWFAQPAMQGTAGWDVAPEPMAADHGHDCGPAPAQHHISTYAQSVYTCKDHLMTAINPPSHGTASGIVVLKPNHLLDLSAGSGKVGIDVSTESRSPFGDWWEIWLSPWEDQVVSPTEHWLHHAGPPKRGIMFQIRNKKLSYKVYDDYHPVQKVEFWEGVTVDDVVEPSMTRRDPYQVRIDGTTVSFHIGNSRLGGALTEMLRFQIPPGLLSDKVVVQFEQSNYEPELNQKVGCPGDPCPVTHTGNTWHWDNAVIEPAIPYTLVNATPMQVTAATDSRVTFDRPAPRGAELLFNGYTKNNGVHPPSGRMQVSFDDGASWRIAPLVRTNNDRELPADLLSYRVAVPEGASSVRVRGEDDCTCDPRRAWAAQNFHVVSLENSTVEPPSTTAAPTTTSSPVTGPEPTTTLPPTTSPPVTTPTSTSTSTTAPATTTTAGPTTTASAPTTTAPAPTTTAPPPTTQPPTTTTSPPTGGGGGGLAIDVYAADSIDGTNTRRLDGGAIKRPTFVFVPARDDILLVDWYLDLKVVHTDVVAPFILEPEDAPLRELALGKHDVVARLVHRDGTQTWKGATFTREAAPDPIPAEVLVANEPGGAGARWLEGKVLSAASWVYFPDDHAIDQVVWYLDYKVENVDFEAPFDLEHRGRALRPLPAGQHTVVANVRYKSGVEVWRGAKFDVTADFATAPRPSPDAPATTTTAPATTAPATTVPAPTVPPTTAPPTTVSIPAPTTAPPTTVPPATTVAAPPSTTTTTSTPVPPPVPGGRTGRFETKDGGIIDPDGLPFLPRGTNVFAGWTFDGSWRSNLLGPGRADHLTGDLGYNLLRVITCPDRSCDHHQGATIAGDDLDAVITEYTRRRVVVLIANYGAPLGGPTGPSADHVAFAAKWFATLATRYRENPYVWFQPFNEPVEEGCCGASEAWVAVHEPVLTAIRATGSRNVIAVNANHFGQDQGWPRRGAADSSILRFGGDLAARHGDVVFDIHWYSRWMGASTSEIRGYFNQIHRKGLTAFIGEIGGVPGMTGFMGQDWLATEAFFAARPDGVGVVMWAGSYETHTRPLFDDWRRRPVRAMPA